MNAPYPGSPEMHAGLRPDALALVDGETEISFVRWNAIADVVAARLTELGLKAGHRIAVRMSVRHEWFFLHAAAGKIGASIVGVNHRLSPPETAFILQDSNPAAFILDDVAPALIIDVWRAAHEGPVISMQPAEGAIPFAALLAGDAGPRAAPMPAQLILYTSGTTGRPKGVWLAPQTMAARANVMEYRQMMATVIPADANSRTLASLPFHHSSGPNTALFSLMAGGAAIMLPRFDAEKALALIARYRVTHMMAVPTMLHRIRALPPELVARYDVSSLTYLSTGAAAVPHSLKLWALDFFGPQCQLFEGYGMSETMMISYLYPNEQRAKPGSSGRVLPYVELSIRDNGGADALPANMIGEVCVRTPMTIEGYLNRAPLGEGDLTPDGLFRTGDVGYLDDDGYLYITDRLKDMIIAGGSNIYPAEIEAVLVEHPSVIDAAVIGVPSDEYGEQPLAFCEVHVGANAADILAFCKGRLATYKTPRDVIFVTELPRNPTGKVIKNTLRAPYWQGRDRQV
jgi:long-chain acyl-CoA synthetase